MSVTRKTGKKSSNNVIRDLVNVGIFAALYIVLAFISSSIGYIPALIVVSTCSISLVTSIPMFLFFSKIERPVLCSLLFCGIFATAMLLMGQGILMGGLFPHHPQESGRNRRKGFHRRKHNQCNDTLGPPDEAPPRVYSRHRFCAF